MIQSMMDVINGVQHIETYIRNLITSIGNIFSGVNLPDLFQSYMPQDITLALAGLLTLLIFLALIGLIKKIVFFLGG